MTSRNLLMIIGLASLPILHGCDQKVNNCSQYQIGNFNYHAKIGDKDLYARMSRTAATQVETDLKTGITQTFGINWKGSCVYELTFIKSSKYMADSAIKSAKAHLAITTILSGTPDYYLFQTTYAGYSFVLKDTMWIVRKIYTPLPVDTK